MPKLSINTLLSLRARALRKYVAIANFSAANYYQTAAGGGEAGVSTGFIEAVLVRPDAATFSTVQMLAQRMNNANAGHELYISGSAVTAAAASGGGPFVFAPARTLAPSDAQRLHLFILQHDGAFMRLWTHRQQAGGNGAAISGYAPIANAHVLGYGFSLFASGVPILSALTARGVPSPIQIAKLFDYVRVNGDLPFTFPVDDATDADIIAMAPRHMYDADVFTPSGGNLGALTNRGTVGGQLNVVAGTVALPTADAALGGALSIRFTTGQKLASNHPASEFAFMHNGAPFDSFTVLVPEDTGTRVVWATSAVAFSGTNFGCWLQTSATPNFLFRAASAAGALINQAGGTPTVGVAASVEMSYAEGASPEAFMAVNGFVVSSGASESAPSVNAPSGTFTLGGEPGAGSIVFNGRVARVILFDRVLSAAERQKVIDANRTKFGVGAIIATHRWSLATTLGDSVTDGELAPPTIEDTITAAAGDRMTRTGSPIVRVIDASGEGLETYGAVGFNSYSNYFESGVSAGFAGSASGFWVVAFARFDSMPGSGTGRILRKQDFQNGWKFIAITGGVVYFNLLSAGVETQNGGTAIATSDLGVVLPIIGVYTGSASRLYMKRGQVGSDMASGFAPTAAAMQFGRDSSGGADVCTLYGLAAGNGVPTPAQISAFFDSWDATRKVQGIPGLVTSQLVDLTRDIAANGGPQNGIPAQVLDRAGTAHLTRMSNGMQVDTSKGLAGLKGASAAGILGTAAGGGIPGAGTGFFVAYDAVLGYANPSTSKGVLALGDTGTKGWYHRIINGSTLQWVVCDSGGTSRQCLLTLVAGDATARQRCVMVHDGANIRLYLGSIGNVVTATCSGLTTHTGPMAFGDLFINGSSANELLIMYGVQGGNAVPTVGEITALLADTSFAAIAGKTSKRWWIPDDIGEAGGAVPLRVRERVAGTDHFIRIGSPLQVAQQKKRLWSYETRPILHGTADFDVSAKSISCAGGTVGEASDLWFALLVVVTSQSSAGTKTLGGKRDGSFTKGWDALIGANNLQIVPRVRTTGGTISGPVASVTQADVGKLLLVGGVLDPSSGVVRTYFNRAQASTGTSLGGTYIPDTTSPCTIGPPVTAVGGATGTTLIGARIFGMMCGRGLPALAQWQAAADAAQVREDLVAIPGMTEHLWSVSRAVKNNGGTMPATIPDLIGTDHMTVAGGLSSEGHYARSWGW